MSVKQFHGNHVFPRIIFVTISTRYIWNSYVSRLCTSWYIIHYGAVSTMKVSLTMSTLDTSTCTLAYMHSPSKDELCSIDKVTSPKIICNHQEEH